MMNPYETVELLAPAGNLACLHAAVRAGANAVYLGTEDFNARRGADNFTLDTLAQACDYAHLRGVNVYLTLNIAVMPQEVKRALELARQAWRRGVDAFIVQDIGLASELRRTLPEARLHVSTQMNTHNIDGVHAAAALGASRVTLAREMTLAEIEEATAEAHRLGIETESFAHGALCVCYSGQCFMSSLIGGRSANRGMCAQACRLPYKLHNAAVKKELPAPGDHLLSPKDLATAGILDAFAATGVDSLKIEGRMKSPEYVYAVVGVYRAVLDRGTAPTEEELRVLAEAFSRGFTTAYLEGERGNDIMSYSRPNNRGVFVGRVLAAGNGEVAVAPDVELHEGDVLEFWTGKGHFAHTLEHFRTDAKGTARFAVERRVNKGDRVFRVRDASAAFVDDAMEPRMGVSCTVRMRVGEPLAIHAACGAFAVDFEGPMIEAARTKAVTAEEVREHVDRLGNTPFYFDALEIDVEDGVGIGFSALHKARTQALKRLTEAMLEGRQERKLSKIEPRVSRGLSRGGRVNVAALASNPACARAAKRAGADVIYVPALNYRRGEACVAGQLNAAAAQAGYPGKCGITMPVVEKAALNAEETVDPWQYVKQGRPFVAENFGQILRGLEEGMQVEVGSHVPVTNALTLDVMAELGVERVWLSPELSLSQIQELGQSTPVSLGATIMGYQELMVTEHCMLMSQGPCNQKCSECVRRKSPHFLEDRKGYQFQVITDCCGRSHIYNAVQLDACHLVCELISAGVTSLLVDTTLMNVEQTSAAVARAVRSRDIAVKGGNKMSKAEGCTTGHLFRGVQ